MKVNKVFAALAVLVTCLTYSFAQELSTPAATEQRTSNYRGDSATISHNNHRASEIIGLNVTTPNKEDTIGEVNDLVIDADSGMVRYAAVSVGGFLGIGDTMVAVPWKAFRHEKDADGNTYLTLDTTKEKLEKAPGFDQDNWPDFGNPQWSTDNDRHYGISVNVNTNR